MFSPLRFKLIATLVLTLVTIFSFAQCKEITASAKVVKKSNDVDGQSILIDIKESDLQALEVSLFGPNRQNILRSSKTEFNNLSSGKYLVVIAGKREEDKYCPKSINVTID